MESESVIVQQDVPQQKRKRRRIWEVDLLRGILILLVALDHLLVISVQYFDLGASFFQKFSDFVYTYYVSLPIRPVAVHIVRALFVFTAGISTRFSRNNVRRGVELLGVAMLLTLGTYLAGRWNLANTRTVWFNVLHVIALCILLTALLKTFKLPSWVYVALGVPLIVAGSIFLYSDSPLQSDNVIVSLLFKTTRSGSLSVDFYPLFPALGFFWTGYYLSTVLYKEKKSLFKKVNPESCKFIRLCGRHTLFVYFVPTIVTGGLLFLLKMILG